MSGFVHTGTESQIDRQAALDQLDRLLASPLFQNSKRSAPFLRYVVHETVEGRSDGLKERRIGIDVFQRDPSYDTAADPIVRTTASEVRKHLAQYYIDSAHESEMRICLPNGCYVPQFLSLKPAPTTNSSASSPPATKPGEASKAISRRRWISAGAVVAPIAAGAVLYGTKFRDPIKEFWGPFWHSADEVFLAIGDDIRGFAQEPAPTDNENTFTQVVGFADVLALGQIIALLATHGKKFDVRRAGSLTLQDLKKAPTVMLGAFNNAWTLRFQDELRFSLQRSQDRRWIADRQKPGTDLVSYKAVAYSQADVDYGIISRFVEARSQQKVLVLAGMGGGATRAAGEFVTGSDHIQALAARAPSGWESKNLQVVIAVDLVNSRIGSPRIHAVHSW